MTSRAFSLSCLESELVMPGAQMNQLFDLIDQTALQKGPIKFDSFR